jgi:hypothetical protein
VEQQRRGDVVGQVADHAQRRRQRAKSNFRASPSWIVSRSGGIVGLAQAGDQVAVDLDHVQVVEPRQQRLGQRAEAGADLDQAVARCGRIASTILR